MEAFVSWINSELNERGWSRSEAARRGGFSPSALDKVIGGFSRPGPKLCRGLAHAFDMSLEEVFRKAELLPTKSRPRSIRDRRVVYEVDTEELILSLWRTLSAEDQERIRDMMERLARPARPAPRIIGDQEES